MGRCSRGLLLLVQLGARRRQRDARYHAKHKRFGREIGADRPLGDDARVPTISRFLGLVIAMYFDDHDPPHFHALHADGEAKVRIDSLELIESTLARRQVRFVLAWAELHRGSSRRTGVARAPVRDCSRSKPLQ